MPSISSIVIQPEGQTYQDRLGDYIRVPVESARLMEGHGIEGDQKASHSSPIRQLNLLSQEWLEKRRLEGYRSGPGQFGEQMILSGLAVESLEPGTRLQLGQAAIIEITKPRTGCTRLEAAQGKSIEGVGPVGALAKVIQSGVIRVGDPVAVLETVQDQAPAG